MNKAFNVESFGLCKKHLLNSIILLSHKPGIFIFPTLLTEKEGHLLYNARLTYDAG
jgi:hypothetical protein